MLKLLGMDPGLEFKVAMQEAEAQGARVVYGDADVQQTLKNLSASIKMEVCAHTALLVAVAQRQCVQPCSCQLRCFVVFHRVQYQMLCLSQGPKWHCYCSPQCAARLAPRLLPLPHRPWPCIVRQTCTILRC